MSTKIMDTSKVCIRICQDGHANALALNKDATQIAVAGRSLLKVFAIDDGFTEVCNMRGGKNQNLSYSSNDVAWSALDNNILATAATNGVVSVWDLSRFGRQKQLIVFNEHERTAHTVTFHNTEANTLISGSQDGTIKAFDLRFDKSINTYCSNSESVRDVKFSPHNPNCFAAVSENGTVHMWDIRRSDKTLLQYTAHSGPIYTCDWHPKHAWLATGSRDKQIKVWNVRSEIKPTLEHTIHTIAVVGRVKWRPEKEHHIASCALVVDYSIYIWDVRRPHIPYASFNEHTNVTTGIGWKGSDPHILLSTSKDSTIYKHHSKDSARPAARANPQGASINYKGDLLFSYKVKVPSKETAIPVKTTSLLNIYNRSRPKYSSPEDVFHKAISNLQTFIEKPASTKNAIKFGPETSKNAFQQEFIKLRGFAKEYLLTGANLSEMCEHNAGVARKYGKSTISLLWMFVKTFYATKKVPQAVDPQRNSNISLNMLTNRILMIQQSAPITIGWGEDIAGATKEDANKLQCVVDDRKSNELKGNKTDGGNVVLGGNDTADNWQVFGDTELTVNNMDCVKGLRNGFLYVGPHDLTRGLSLSGGATQIDHDFHTRTHEVNAITEHRPVESPPVPEANNLLKVTSVPVPPIWEPHNVLAEFLTLKTDIGDVQTPACILIALGDRRNELPLDELTYENWLLSYVDVLHRHRLWVEATEIINLAWIPSVAEINHQSTAVHTNCGDCGRPILGSAGWYCSKCRSVECSKCSICHEVVRGLYAWCQGCSHGGHVSHMKKWFANHETCPKCDHVCEYE